MASPSRRTDSSAAESPSWPARVAWYCLLATAVAVPLVNTLLIGRPWGLYTLTDDPYHTPKLLVLVALLVVATVAWSFDILQARRGLRVGPVSAALGVFVVLAGASTLASPNTATSFFGASTLMTGALTWFASLWSGVLVTYYVTGGQRLRTLSRVVALSGAAVGAVALLQALWLDPLGTQMREDFLWMVVQGMSTTGNPNYTGALLVVPLVVALALAISETDVRWRWAAGISAVICAAALFNTLTRAAWIGALVGVVVLVLIVPGAREHLKRRLLVIGGAVLSLMLLSMLLLNPAMLADRFTSLVQGADAFASGRLTLWSDVSRVIAAHPWLGTGADRLGVAAYPYQSDVIVEGGSRLILQDPHSMPLLVAAVFGIPAALALLTALVLAVRAGFVRLRAESGGVQIRTLYAGWVAGLVGLLATSLLSVTMITLIYMLFLALGVVLAPTLRRADTRLWPSLAAGGLALAVLLVGLWGTWLGTRASHEFVLARYADSQYHLERALALTPWDSRMHSEYLFLKIGGMQPVLAGQDVAAAQQAASEIDAQIRLAQLDFPGELLFYRARLALFAASEGAPGYQPELYREAVEEAAAAFPNEPAFADALQELETAE